MKKILIFDVDGTLTPPLSSMEDDMVELMWEVLSSYIIYLVTGSDISKLHKQIPAGITENVNGVFCCSGNEFWKGDELIYREDFDFSDDLIVLVEDLIDNSKYPIRTGNHIEKRIGSLNISVVGRNADINQRQDYFDYDLINGERANICTMIEEQFSEYEACRGGQISIDISPVGWNKSQIVKEIEELHSGLPIHFFGDMICEGGNDLSLANKLQAISDKNVVYPVKNYQETMKILIDNFLNMGYK